MPSNTVRLDALIADWNGLLRRAADELAQLGEEDAKRDYTWDDDTGSAQASITGYEALTGDPFKNFNDQTWLGAQSGAIKSKYHNSPFNYVPHPHQANYDEANHPVAVVGLMVDYALDPSFTGGDEFPKKVESTLKDTLSRMTNRLDEAFGNADIQGLLK